MTAKDLERLEKKYSSSAIDQPQKKQLNMMGRGGPQGMHAKGKPKNTKKTIVRTFRYLGKQKALLWIAVFFCHPAHGYLIDRRILFAPLDE